MRVLPVAKRKTRRAHAPGHFLRKFCKNVKETRRTANSASSGTLQGWVRAASYQAHLNKKHIFFKKYVFPTKHSCQCNVGAGLSGSLSCCHFLCVLSRGSFTLQYTHFLIFSCCLGVLCSRGTPRTSCFALFSEGFLHPRVY